MSSHALLSPSSAERWLHCPLAPRLEAQLPYKPSVYADEGTLAHSVCELSAKKYFTTMKKTDFSKELKNLKSNSLWNDEMIQTADSYVEHLKSQAMYFQFTPYITFEVKVDISDYAPEAFGRCDCIMFGSDTLIITDYKHGKGVHVSAERNPQMMLYALGALKLYQPLFGDSIKNIKMCIDQPRLNSYEVWNCSKSDLLAWGDEIKPLAQKAFMGIGEYKSGSWCRFCRANGICKAQSEQVISAFDDFFNAGDLLTPEQISDALKEGEVLTVWFDNLKQRAYEMLLKGEKIPDFKLVEGRSSRTWKDQNQALATLEQNGIKHDDIYQLVPKSLAQLEKLIGVSKFKELVGSYIIKPQGKPTMVESDDPRPDFNSALSDFS